MLFIRVDANKHIATGHMMRCMAIASQACKSGIKTIFITADGSGDDLLDKAGYEHITLNSAWNDMESETEKLLALIKEKDIKKLIIDSYQVTEIYLKRIKDYTEVIYIDDLNMFRYPVNCLICYAPYYNKFGYKDVYKDSGTRLLLGTKYLPLRENFLMLPTKKIKEKPEELLILSGGGDQSELIIKIIRNVDFSYFSVVNIICGNYCTNIDKISTEVCNVLKRVKGCEINILSNVRNIEKYMMSADIAISAGGTTLYELSACGTPTISYIAAENQRDNVSYFDKESVIKSAGAINDKEFINNLNSLLEQIKDYNIRALQSSAMKKLVDGKGCQRIIEEI